VAKLLGTKERENGRDRERATLDMSGSSNVLTDNTESYVSFSLFSFLWV